ncbi:hypothetical protein SDC9_122472 [bioreactor metagenome]|uniref:Uncharacterized protein n=1 Tax=bioreactor metagenome TaxID=1076179 RepID=A0A645CES9_9ZZZZ
MRRRRFGGTGRIGRITAPAGGQCLLASFDPLAGMDQLVAEVIDPIVHGTASGSNGSESRRTTAHMRQTLGDAVLRMAQLTFVFQ